MASLEQQKETVRRVFEDIWNKADPTFIEDFFSRDYELHDPNQGRLQGPDGAQANIAFYKAAFPDLLVEIDDMLGEEDRIATRWHASGTHLGTLGETDPTGNSASFSALTVSRFDAVGKIAEEWNLVDMFGLLKQLDALIQPEEYEAPIGQPAGEDQSPPL